MEKTDPNSVYVSGVALALIGILYAVGFSLFTVLLCFLAVSTGAFVGSMLLADSFNEHNTVSFILETVFRERLKKPKRRSSLVKNIGGIGKLPWHGLELPEPVNVAVEDLIEQLVDNYINSWYQAEISSDHAFVNEIRYQIRYASAVFFRKLNDVDLSETILNEIVPIAVVHADRICTIEEGLDKQTLPPLMVETKILEKFPDVHCVMTSRQAECDYLRSLADFLVGQLIDESRVAGRSLDEESPMHNIALPLLRNKKWPSHSCRHFLRELLVYSFFMPVLDLLADPDTINTLLLLLFDPEPMAEYPITKSKRVPFLNGLTKAAVHDTPESLIQLKLSEIVRDPRHLQMFSMYLKDSKGPTNVLKFLLQADDVHSRMQHIGINNEMPIEEIPDAAVDSSTTSLPRALTDEERRKLDSEVPVSEFQRAKLEREAQKNWDKFYLRNKDNFFKDRHWSRTDLENLCPDIDFNAPLKYLEAGCGVGNMLFPLTEYFPNWSFYGFDFSKNAVRLMNERAAQKNLTITSAVIDLTAVDEAEATKFPECDVVSLIFVLSAIHPDKHASVIASLRRFVSLGGSVILRDYAIYDHAMLRFGRGAKIEDRFYVRQDGTRAYYFTTEELEELFTKNGFKAERVEYLFRQTVNHQKQLSVQRIFLQGRFTRVE
uniref:PXA domain-containing protein n=1 Tax=Steinernema glaseri TaxID=37863 RepID=A0A1I7YSC1_9BILA